MTGKSTRIKIKNKITLNKIKKVQLWKLIK